MREIDDKRVKNPNYKAWKHPKGSGISILVIDNRTRGEAYGVSYRVSIPKTVTGNKKILRQFPTKEEAFKYSEQEYSGKQKHGEDYFALTSPQRVEALQAIKILRGSDISLIEAANCALTHLKPKAGEITVQDLFTQFLEEKAGLNKRVRYLRDLKSRIGIFADTFGDRKINTISEKDIKDWLKGMERLSLRSRLNYRRLVQVFFNHAVDQGYCAENPVSKIPRSVEDWKPPCVLTLEEAERLIKTAHKTHYKGNEKASGFGLLPYIALGMFAGIRSTELFQLDWRQVHLDRKFVTIPHTIAKKRRLRNVELQENAIQWLRLVERKTGKIAPVNLYKRFKALTMLAGFPDWRGTKSNAMRSSFASYMYAKTQNANLTAAQMGHRGGDQELFDHYRALSTREEGQKYFEITPESVDGNLVAFPKVAG